ncbi:hypothetical protein [Actinoplanes sp. NPDC051411]|uniref:hypothetical protein n=1 Tax=Actinoplanes sp. NPDC051411 TaxID=3155522 RepID=UPI0034159D8E
MFRIDPFARDGGLKNTVGSYLLDTARPFRAVLATTVLLAAAGAAIEVWLIWYAGHVVDLLTATTPATLLARHGGELLGAGLLVLVVRPALKFTHEGLDDLVLRPNLLTLATWRPHRHVARQPVGWFRRDLTGRRGDHQRVLLRRARDRVHRRVRDRLGFPDGRDRSPAAAADRAVDRLLRRPDVVHRAALPQRVGPAAGGRLGADRAARRLVRERRHPWPSSPTTPPSARRPGGCSRPPAGPTWRSSGSRSP